MAVYMLLVVGLMVLVIAGVFREIKRKRDIRPLQSSYAVRGSLLSAAERSFYGVLIRVDLQGLVVAMKVRLADLVEVAGVPCRAAFNRISAKHVDFVLLDVNELRPCLAIELDDGSHARPNRQARDRFVDDALGRAGLPVLRVAAQFSYDPKALERSIAERLGSVRPLLTARAKLS